MANQRFDPRSPDRQATIQEEATTGNGDVVILAEATQSSVYIEWSAGCTAGEVTVEAASRRDYTGTWGVLAVVPWVSASREDVVQIAAHVYALRARISDAIVGGTVTVRVSGRQ